MLKPDFESIAMLKTQILTEMQPSSDEGINYSSIAVIPNITSEGTLYIDLQATVSSLKEKAISNLTSQTFAT